MLVYMLMQVTTIPFRKNNEHQARKILKRPLGKENLSIRVYEGQKEALKNIPEWQERLREYIDKLIKDSLTGD